MYTFAQRPYVFDANFFRWIGRMSALVLAVIWAVMVVSEAIAFRFQIPAMRTFYQAAAMGIVFGGYAIGWRQELIGGLLAIVGTLVFYAVHVATLETLPEMAAALFAVPGVFYLLAWYGEHRNPATLEK
jgi:hypothetical protein